MKSKELITQKVDDTIKVLDTIEEVKVNHFFKHKVLQEIENQKEVKPKTPTWLTPQFQLATLGLILLMNLSAVYYAQSTRETNNNVTLENFALEYALQTETNSLLN